MARNIPKQLQNGLVMWLDGNGKNLVGTGTLPDGTLTGTPPRIRVLQNDGNSYNGSSQYALISDSGNIFSGTSLITASLWFKTSTTGAGQFLIAGWEKGSWLIKITSGNVLETLIYTGSVSTNTTSLNVTDGKWHNAVLVYDGATHKTYCDGIQILSNSKTGNMVYSGTPGVINIATNNQAGPTYSDKLTGSVINPMIWNRALSATEIQILHKSLYIR